MNKFFIGILCFCIFFLAAGCELPWIQKDIVKTELPPLPEPVQTEQEDEPVPAVKDFEKVEVKKPTQLPEDEIYMQWAIEFPDPEFPDFYDYATSDCIGLANRNTYGGDLLSSLIVDGNFRTKLDLDVYQKDYVRALEKKLAEYSQAAHQSDFYAFYACHLDDNMDLVAGYYWPRGSKTNQKLRYEDAHLLIVNNDRAYEYDNVKTLNNSATGAEAYPCTAELLADSIQWSCFLGVAQDVEGGGSNMEHWTLSLYGAVWENWEDIETLEDLNTNNIN